ncbi:pyridoxal phosphate-dependent decarboxylase family protein [Egicoccus halophilus]|uniref:Aspartate aminotransferase family protein n=1 Tax=Egicoccus halophilus TaxID=1670830 RepID=A0A8J3ACL4_9ACTN|nr:aspartate aminotransferase family protein [Egicoccus halophilus]GGI03797.1 aspartate aminotransferase family protein [Egicoccus halophilus]
MTLPHSGLPRDEVFARLDVLRRDDLDSRGGRTWAYVYDSGRAEVDEVAGQAYLAFLHENGLDPTVFPSVLAMENDVVGIAVTHLGGDEHAVGSFTSGGTESCMLAVKAARDRLRERSGPGRARVVLPDTAHAAFSKAAHYFDLEEVRVGVDPTTFAADAAALTAAIDERTALVVVSAPQYAHGVMDPVEAVAAVTAERDVWLHVDACIGGWLLPYAARLGVEVPPFDFRVPGVTSISMDLHKYAYCPKGASVVLYRDADLRRHQFYACADWSGYTVINPTMQSTKSAGPLAAAWATLHHVGDDGYLDVARRTQAATRRLIDGIAAIDGLEVLGDPRLSLVAAHAPAYDVFEVVDEMKRRGWYVQPQLAHGASPANVHFSVTATSEQVVDAMLEDLAAACEHARGIEVSDERRTFLAALRGLDPDAFTPEMYAGLLAAAGLGRAASGPNAGDGAALPPDMATINAMLDALPAALRERLLIAFLGELFRPAPGGRADAVSPGAG